MNEPPLDRSRIVRLLREWGLNVLPAATDGSKAIHPLFGKWGRFITTPPPLALLERFVTTHPECGLSTVCGASSGNLLIVDVDDGAIIAPLLERLRAIIPQIGNDAPIVSTPSGGLHVYLRTPHPLPSQHLAFSADNKISIETRGHGATAISPYLSAFVHQSKRPYTITRGTLQDIPFCTEETVSSLFSLAASFSQKIAPVVQKYRETRTNGAGDHFTGKSWQDILLPAGWQLVKETTATLYWRRPHKDEGISATTRLYESGVEYFYVFSSNGFPFETGRGYSKFACYTLLHCHGDFKASFYTSRPSLLKRLVGQ